MKRVFLAVLVGLFSNISFAGKLFISGQDSDDNGHVTVAFGAQILNFLATGNTNGGSGILILGGSGGTSRTVIDSWNTAGRTITQASTIAEIAAANLNAYAAILMPSDSGNVGGGMTQAQLDAINLRSGAIAAFVNGGGNLGAFTQNSLTNSYRWFPGCAITTTPSSFSDAQQTPALAAAGFSATNAELNGDLWHLEFTGPAGFCGLNVLATRPGGAAVLLGGGVGTIVGPATPQVFTPVPTLEFWALCALALGLITLVGRRFR